MENYVKVFELFDKRNSVFKNASVDKIEGQSKQPYTQTINYFFTFDEAKKKISSIWNFSTPELNKRIDKEISPSLIRKFGDKVKDKLGLSKEREIKIKSLTSLGISENKVNNQLFHYTYKGLRIAKIEFDRTKVHNRSWKLIFYYYDGVNGDASKKVTGEIPSDNKKKEDNIPGNIESNKQGEENNKPKELGYKKDIVVPFIDSSKKALDFIKKHLDYIYKTSNKEFEIGDMKVLKDSDKEFKIKTNNRTIEVKDPVILKGLNYAFNYQKPSDAKQLGNGESQEEPKKTDKEINKNTEEKVDTFEEHKKKEEKPKTELEIAKDEFEKNDNPKEGDVKKLFNIIAASTHPDHWGSDKKIEDYTDLENQKVNIYDYAVKVKKSKDDSKKKYKDLLNSLKNVISIIKKEAK